MDEGTIRKARHQDLLPARKRIHGGVVMEDNVKLIRDLGQFVAEGLHDTLQGLRLGVRTHTDCWIKDATELVERCQAVTDLTIQNKA